MNNNLQVPKGGNHRGGIIRDVLPRKSENDRLI